MDFRILGPLEVVGDKGPITLPRGRARTLLALLILRAGEVVAADRLIDQLWGAAPPPTATTALHGLVSTLRKRLQPAGGGPAEQVLATRPPGYVLAVAPEQVDAERFRRLLARAASAPAEERAATLREALAMWRGPVLTDVAYEPFAQATIAALEELRLTALEGRIDADIALGRHAEVIAELEALAAQHPLRERLVGQLMLALYRCGRQSEALDVLAAARRRLADDLGLDPNPALKELERAILRQDPSLVAAPPATADAPGDGAGRWLPEERRTVTIVFIEVAEPADTAAGTAQGSDPETFQQVMRRCLDAVRQVITLHGGTVQGVIGGVVVAIFGVPTAHEDDALRAVRAAAEVRAALAGLSDGNGDGRTARIATRIGVNTGEIVAGPPELPAASGHAVTVASRLQQAAGDGEVLLGEQTRRLVAQAAALEAMDGPPGGRDGSPSTAWRLLDVPADAAPAACPAGGLVGRQRELQRLRTAFARSVRDRHAVAVTVVGEPGIGKSRLAREFAATVGAEALVLTGRCPAYGEGITLWPLREVVEQIVGAQQADLVPGELLAALGLGQPGQTGDLFPAVRRLLTTLARSHPVVVVLDDVHWAQPTLLDLIEYLAATTEAAVLLVCLARPELREQRPAWLADRDLLLLEALTEDDSRRLVDARRDHQLAPEVVADVVAAARGNPLFVEQLLAALWDDGGLALPPSLQALLAARLDLLAPAERDLLRCAAVVGTHGPVAALDSLVPHDARPFVQRHLGSLRNKELVEPVRRERDEQTFGFRHVLIQQAAYRTLTRQDRSQLHERVATWYEEHGEQAAADADAVVGYHLEQAHGQRRQLGLVDDHTRLLAVRAGERLAAAGLRAYARVDAAATENLLSRARALLPADHPRRGEILTPLAEMYQALGRHRDAERVLDETLEAARAEGDELGERRIGLERLRIRIFTGREAVAPAHVREAEQTSRLFERMGDDVGIAQHSNVVSLVHLRRGRLREMEALARRGLAHAVRAGQPRDEVATRWWVALALVEGPTAIPRCILECRQIARNQAGWLHPGVLLELARLRAMRSELEKARHLIVQARALLIERVRGRRPLMFVAQRHAQVEALAGDLTVAEREFRAALGLATDMEEPDHVAQIAAELSLLLGRRGASDEAARLAALAADRSPEDSVTAQGLSRAAAARVTLVRGDDVGAEQLGAQAIAAVPDEMLNLRAWLHVELAQTVLATGQRDRAAGLTSVAVDLYERKGNVAGARWARQLASAPSSVPH